MDCREAPMGPTTDVVKNKLSEKKSVKAGWASELMVEPKVEPVIDEHWDVKARSLQPPATHETRPNGRRGKQSVRHHLIARQN